MKLLPGDQVTPHYPSVDLLFGKTKEMQTIRRRLESVAKTSIPTLVQGESGTGKELCVQMIHRLSTRASGPLVKVNCPAIPHALLETELFGYEKGAFTGANFTRKGRVDQSHGGTLFLDEVGSLDLGMQAKLLQVLQDGTFMRVGGQEMRSIDMRLVSVANRSLRDQVQEGTFRLDFLFRINAMTIELPPLRRRMEDLADLVDFFLEQHARAFNIDPKPLSAEVMRQMHRYEWPGNIRQLDNLVRSYVLIGNEDALLGELVGDEIAAPKSVTADLDMSNPISLKQVTKRATQELERQIILKVLKANSWNRQKTAKWLQISYRSLLYKLNDAGRAEVPTLRRAGK